MPFEAFLKKIKKAPEFFPRGFDIYDEVEIRK
jgi:hypothetical protein